jgi:histidinol dehydrogenase
MIATFESVTAFIRARGDDLAAAAETDPEVLARVQAILSRVKIEGDHALVALAAELDGVSIDSSRLRVRPEDIAARASQAPAATPDILRRAAENIRLFHEHQRPEGFRIESPDGTLLEQKVTPIDVVGVYVPGGKAVYPSTLLMNAIPAKIAGVPRIVVATPPGTIERSAEVAAALDLLGLSEVYQVGGAQAIAALAYGTETVPRVDKIVGPGNAYVAAAKRLVYGLVGIDHVAGPSEIAVLADDSADPRYVAADLLSQAEHGSGDERAVLVTTSAELARRVEFEIGRQMETLPRATEVAAVIERNGAIVVAQDMTSACDFINRIAPEHVEVLTAEAEVVAVNIRHAGAIFIGPFSPVPVGDYYAGPNHVLPTGSAARFGSPLGVYDFVKRSSVIRYSRERLAADRGDIEALARAEGFEAHARAVAARFEP